MITNPDPSFQLPERLKMTQTHRLFNVKKLHKAAIIPQYQTQGSANMDFHALIEEDIDGEGAIILKPGAQVVLRTGLAFETPAGWAMEIHSRSGHGFKNEVRLSNSTGQIDEDYRKEVFVALKNDSRVKFTIRHGDRIAQFRFVRAEKFALNVVDDMTDPGTRAGGLGSTGSR